MPVCVSQGPVCMVSYLVLSGLLLTRLRRPASHMTVTEQTYEGEYRYVNSRLITNRSLIYPSFLISPLFLLFLFNQSPLPVLLSIYRSLLTLQFLAP